MYLSEFFVNSDCKKKFFSMKYKKENGVYDMLEITLKPYNITLSNSLEELNEEQEIKVIENAANKAIDDIYSEFKEQMQIIFADGDTDNIILRKIKTKIILSYNLILQHIKVTNNPKIVVILNNEFKKIDLSKSDTTFKYTDLVDLDTMYVILMQNSKDGFYHENDLFLVKSDEKYTFAKIGEEYMSHILKIKLIDTDKII